MSANAVIKWVELERLQIIEKRALAFMKADGSCKVHHCGQSREQRGALQEALEPGFLVKLQEDELRAKTKAWIAGTGPMPNPLEYSTPEGRKVGTIPPRAPEVSYEDFWASAPLDAPSDNGGNE